MRCCCRHCAGTVVGIQETNPEFTLACRAFLPVIGGLQTTTEEHANVEVVFQDAVPTAFLITTRAINIGQELMRAAGDEQSEGGDGETDGSEESDEESEEGSFSPTPRKRGAPASIPVRSNGSVVNSEPTAIAIAPDPDDADKAADDSSPMRKRGRP